MISDTILAFNHFRLKSKLALAASLAIYWTAQWLVVRSVGACIVGGAPEIADCLENSRRGAVIAPACHFHPRL